MKKNYFLYHQQKPTRFLPYIVSILLLVSLSCSISTTSSSSDQSTVQTQTSLNVLLTMSAMNASQGEGNATAQALNATQVAQSAQATVLAQQAAQLAQQSAAPTADIAATQVALSVQATTNAQQAAPNTNPPPSQGGQINTGDFETWMKSAKILLFEDMTGRYDTTRWIQEALDSLGLEYQDEKDAQGNFKNSLLMGASGGEPWDLIISASEDRKGIQGEFFDYFNTALNNGSSLIMEHWAIDSFSQGKIGTLLSKCGVRFQADWFSVGFPIPDSEQVMYPYDGTSPVLHEPNEGIRISNPNNFWWNWMFFIWGWGTGDYGDFLEKLPGSDAVIVLGQKSQDKTRYATLVTCLDGRMTIQTFSTHSYGHDRIVPLWQNTIYQALKARYALINK